jgi:hypothetical protein
MKRAKEIQPPLAAISRLTAATSWRLWALASGDGVGRVMGFP